MLIKCSLEADPAAAEKCSDKSKIFISHTKWNHSKSAPMALRSPKNQDMCGSNSNTLPQTQHPTVSVGPYSSTLSVVPWTAPGKHSHLLKQGPQYRWVNKMDEGEDDEGDEGDEGLLWRNFHWHLVSLVIVDVRSLTGRLLVGWLGLEFYAAGLVTGGKQNPWRTTNHIRCCT